LSAVTPVAREVPWSEYGRREQLAFFRRYPNPFWSATFELDATAVRRRARAAGVSTYASLVWAFHRALLDVEAFRFRLIDERLFLFDTLCPGLTVPGPGGVFNFSELDWHADFTAFHRAASPALAAASARREFDTEAGGRPEFAYYTALPQVPFTGFTHAPLPDPLAGQPDIAFGRFRQDGDRTWVPVGLQVNHVYIDGAAVGALVETAGRSFAD
jgi:chloramphenicol O-acetyltransferase type A